MSRDNFACSLCGSTFEKLTVHHLYYTPDADPWDYDNEAFVTLCDGCHKYAHTSLQKITALIAFEVLKKRRDLTDLNDFLCQI